MNKQIKGQTFEKGAKFNDNFFSRTSSRVWCDLKSKGCIFKLHDMCSNPKRKFQKQVMLTPRKFQLEGNGFKKNHKKFKNLE